MAILYSNDSAYGIDFMKFSDKVSYRTIMRQIYGALYRANVGIDFVFPDSTNLSDYKMIVVPPLYVASDALLARLADYVRGGGHLVVCFKSGFTNEYSTVRWEMAPGPLREAAGLHYQEFSNLKEPLHLKDDPYHAGEQNSVSDWAEMLILDTAKPLAYYDHPFFGKYPAITRSDFGKGTLTYEGTALSDGLQSRVLREALRNAGVSASDATWPATVSEKDGTNRRGKVLHYYFNYSNDSQHFTYSHGTRSDLLSQASVAAGQSVTLQPWGVAIVEEQ